MLAQADLTIYHTLLRHIKTKCRQRQLLIRQKEVLTCELVGFPVVKHRLYNDTRIGMVCISNWQVAVNGFYALFVTHRGKWHPFSDKQLYQLLFAFRHKAKVGKWNLLNASRDEN
jgi:hypothetical protein